MLRSEELQYELAMANSSEMGERVSYAIWGSVARTTRAFSKVSVKINPDTCRIFVEITLRKWATIARLKLLRDAWLSLSESRAKDYIPSGWRVLIYYGNAKDDRDDASGDRPNVESIVRRIVRSISRASRGDKKSGSKGRSSRKKSGVKNGKRRR